MKKIDRRADLKLSIPFLNKDGDLIKSPYPFKIEIFTNNNIKKIANVYCFYTVDIESNEQIITYTFDNCFFKDVKYTNKISKIEKIGPTLIIPLNKPAFQPGNLKITIYIYKPDIDFRYYDNEKTIIKTMKTNIEII